jgi:hypothetical protein
MPRLIEDFVGERDRSPQHTRPVLEAMRNADRARFSGLPQERGAQEDDRR